MRIPIGISTVALFAVLGGQMVKAGDGVVATTPVFDRIVSYTLPPNFVPSFEQANDRAYIQEAVPAGESVENWATMITMTGQKDAAGRGQTLETAAETLADHYQQACPDTFNKVSIGPGQIDGHAALMVFLGCGTVAAAQGSVSETAIILFIKTPTGHYTLQWAEHAAAQAAKPQFDATHWNPRLAALQPIRVCKRVEGEQPPYPSCNARK